MKRTKFLVVLGALVCAPAFGAGGGPLPYSFEPDHGNLPSIQRGARNYMAYCASCHSMKHLRYGRIGQDLGIPEDLLRANLMFTSDKPGEPIRSAMPQDASNWFGQYPPDLSVETRTRGPSWVYSYLLSFYVDTSRPLGVNNVVLAGASMPHVLWELQGWQALSTAPAGDDGHGGDQPRFEQLTEGSLSPAEYEKFVADTVNFMAYAAEPGKAGRIALGIKVMLYLLLLTVLAYFLKKEYWKDVR
jgi:ubiquinol-cytochrome c reductase cytochrome c1 subunit